MATFDLLTQSDDLSPHASGGRHLIHELRSMTGSVGSVAIGTLQHQGVMVHLTLTLRVPGVPAVDGVAHYVFGAAPGQSATGWLAVRPICVSGSYDVPEAILHAADDGAGNLSLRFGGGAPGAYTYIFDVVIDAQGTDLQWTASETTGGVVAVTDSWIVGMPTARHPFRTVSTDADFTVTPSARGDYVRHTGTLTANRMVTLSVAPIGSTVRFLRTGSGAFNLSIGGIKNLTTGTWCEIIFTGSVWVVSGYGTL